MPMPNIVRCRKCGAGTPADSPFCKLCGAPLAEPAAVPRSERPQLVVPEHESKPVLALVLAIFGLCGCGFISAIPALLISRSLLKRIDAGEVPGTRRPMLQAAYWISIATIVLSVFFLGLFALILMVGGSTS